MRHMGAILVVFLIAPVTVAQTEKAKYYNERAVFSYILGDNDKAIADSTKAICKRRMKTVARAGEKRGARSEKAWSSHHLMVTRLLRSVVADLGQPADAGDGGEGGAVAECSFCGLLVKVYLHFNEKQPIAHGQIGGRVRGVRCVDPGRWKPSGSHRFKGMRLNGLTRQCRWRRGLQCQVLATTSRREASSEYNGRLGGRRPSVHPGV